MRKSRYTEEQIIGFIKQADSGLPIKDPCSTGGFRDATFNKWRAKYDGMDVPDAGACVNSRPRTSNSRCCRTKPT